MTEQSGFFDLFSPPKGFLGSFGWVCGFTASAAVMKEIADRFTQGAGTFVATHRRHALFLITDQASGQIKPHEAPGVHHMTLGPKWAETFKGGGLFHAKVALLHFLEERPQGQKRPKEILRLVVSTGNWTRETTESNIDLFWRTEVRFVDRKPAGQEGDDEALADIQAAFGMFQAIRPALSPNPWQGAAQPDDLPDAGLARLVEGLARPKAQPRFFHSLYAPLRQPLLARFPTATRPGTKADLLLMGSGFYAGGDPARSEGDEPQGAEAFLVDLASDLTSKQPKWPVTVVLNRDACQGLAEASRLLVKSGWQFFEPRFPEGHSSGAGKLHAKFIYRGKRKTLDGVLYIGSGNLTPAGLGVRRSGGFWNFEAGVAFPVKSKASPEVALPWDSGKRINLETTKLQFGELFHRSELFDGSCPISHFTLRETDEAHCLEPGWAEPETAQSQAVGVEARHSGGEWQSLDGRIELERGTRPPAQVDLRTPGSKHHMTVPVLGEAGALVLPELHYRRLEDVLDALMLVDQTGRDSDLSGEENDGGLAGTGSQTTTGDAGNGDIYFSRRLMAVITALGESQAGLRVDQCRLWAARLVEHSRSLKRTEPAVIKNLQDMQLNPFSHLSREEFMPVGLTSDDAGVLRAAHDQVAALWGLKGFDGFVREVQA